MTSPRRLPLLLTLSFAVSFAVAACGADGPSDPATATPEPAATSPVVDAGPTPTPDAGATLPGESPIPASEAPLASQPADGGSGTVTPVAADACSGSTDNQSFFAVAAESLSWQVYCASLPDGWLVQSGSYRLGSGGSLKVAYAGPGGARFELRQGAMCAEDSSCAPSGGDLGIVPWGDREARLLAWDGGGYAAMVDGGAPLSWVAYGVGLDEASFRAVVAGLLPVAAAP